MLNDQNITLLTHTSSIPQEFTLHVLLPVNIPVLVDHVLYSDSPLTMLAVVSVAGDDRPLVSGVKLFRAFWTLSMYDSGRDSSGFSGSGRRASTLL